MSDELKVTFVRGEERWTLTTRRGASLFKLARSKEIPVDTLCHGMGSCVRCKVRLIEGELSPPTAVERDKMGNIFHLTGERMACQVRVMSDVTLELSAPRKARDKAKRSPSRTS